MSSEEIDVRGTESDSDLRSMEIVRVPVAKLRSFRHHTRTMQIPDFGDVQHGLSIRIFTVVYETY